MDYCIGDDSPRAGHKPYRDHRSRAGTPLVSCSAIPRPLTCHRIVSLKQSDRKTIIGQCNISHPISSSTSATGNVPVLEGLEDDHEGQSPHNVEFHKDVQSTLESKLEAPIERVFYINAYGQEIYPSPNPEFLQSLERRKALVYSCGSLWTRRVLHFSRR